MNRTTRFSVRCAMLVAFAAGSVGVVASPATAAVPALDNPSIAGHQFVPQSGRHADTSARSAAWIRQGPFYIRNAGTGRCLDAHANGGGVNGNVVGLWDCNGGVTERWYIDFDTTRGDYPYRLVNVKSGRCLDYPASSGGVNGYQYVLWDCVGSTGQYFRISDHNQQVGGRLLAVQLGGPHNHVDAFANGGGGNGNPVGNWAWTGHPLQHWAF